MKLGILGGTFNPIHNGHLIIGQYALEEYELDKLLIMPTGLSYLKSRDFVLSREERAKMVMLAIEGEDHFEFSDYEIKKEGNTYTCETLEYFKRIYPKDELFFIIGEDSLFSMESWFHPELIFKYADILVAVRDRDKSQGIEEKIKELKEGYRARIHLIHSPRIDISSTAIRERIKEGKSVRFFLPDKVNDYITENKVYTSSSCEG
ncbi:MAG: nicotinate-nucleotide adenylyltransferase [Lachnospiraceae bacterium]|nr:nicotinate-nucleotide adenylyltransferase [Lachnospiraceae bacterium]